MLNDTASVVATFLEGRRNMELLLTYCEPCDMYIYFPRLYCPNCFSDSLEWARASGEGSVYSCTTIDHAGSGDRVLAIVELAEGPRMMSNIVGNRAAASAIGSSVYLEFVDDDSGVPLPVFRLKS